MTTTNNNTTTFTGATKDHNDFSKYKVNPAYAGIHDGITAAKNNLLTSLPKINVMVHEILPFPRPDRNNRIGHIMFQVPAGMMQVKHWDGKAINWLPMEQYDYDGMRPTRSRLMFGSGFIKLAIKEGHDGMPFVSWPREKGKNDVWYDVFKAANAGQDFFHSDNCYNIQAALSAYLLTYWGEFKQADPRNRFGFNEHCGNCRHNNYLAIHDQMGDDYENKANPIDTSELTQYGSRMPQWVCGVFGEFTDEQAIDDLNEYGAYEIRHYDDRETGQMRWLRPNEVLVKGVPVSTYKVRADGTAERCATCPFYAKNERKSDKSLGKEVTDAVDEYVRAGGAIQRDELGKLDLRAMKVFVPKYWTERAQTSRQAVFTYGIVNFSGGAEEANRQIVATTANIVERSITEGNPIDEATAAAMAYKQVVTDRAEWKVGFPGEMDVPLSIMVQGFGGIEVHGTQAMNETMKFDFVATTEAYRQDDAQLAKLINIIHNICNNFVTVEPDTMDALVAMVTDANGKAMKDPLKSRYTRALARLAQTIEAHE